MSTTDDAVEELELLAARLDVKAHDDDKEPTSPVEAGVKVPESVDEHEEEEEEKKEDSEDDEDSEDEEDFGQESSEPAGEEAGEEAAQITNPEEAKEEEEEEEGNSSKSVVNRLLDQMGGPVIDVPDDHIESESVKEEFLCGFQRKSVSQPCDFCQGGCSAEDGMPGLRAIEAMVVKAYPGSEVSGSGYSNVDDIFVVDVKGAEGHREYFLSGEGHELGWLKLDDDMAAKSADEAVVDVISRDTAAKIALKTIGGQVMGVDATNFIGEDAFVVEIEDGNSKSYDVFVGIDGKVLGYDEFSLADDTLTEDETNEIKVLEAELHFKRLYSRERRQELAKSGEAMADGSFPIVDGADLSNAVLAYGRASDPEAAKAHIIKRAQDLGLTDSLPDGWVSSDAQGTDAPTTDTQAVDAPSVDAPSVDAPPVDAPPEEDPKKATKSSFAAELAEFKSIADELNLS